MTEILYDYWRSSAAYRVRIVCNLKGLEPECHCVDLRRGTQRGSDFLALNPSGLVPVWQDGAFRLTQSLAIIEYLDEIYPNPPLLPGDARARATVREMALMIAADIHPIVNLRVQNKLNDDFEASDEKLAAWRRHWISIGFTALEAHLVTTSGRYAFEDQVTLADACLVPQVYNARRFGLDLTPFPNILRVNNAACALAPIAAASPDRQPDAE